MYKIIRTNPAGFNQTVFHDDHTINKQKNKYVLFFLNLNFIGKMA